MPWSILLGRHSRSNGLPATPSDRMQISVYIWDGELFRHCVVRKGFVAPVRNRKQRSGHGVQGCVGLCCRGGETLNPSRREPDDR